MLIYLDDSINHQSIKVSPAHDVIDSLEDIASIIRSGTHLVTGNISTLKFLSTLEYLGVSARAAFKAVANKYTQFASAKKLVNTYTEIVFSSQSPSVNTRDGVTTITIPLAHVRNLSLKNPTEIIYEEIQDESIYEIITRWYLKTNVSPGLLNRNYRSIHGGGGRTYAVYSEAQNRNNQFCLCITDSDKKFPADTPGPTSTEVRNVNRSDRVLSCHLDLDFHEVENLVPLKFLKESCTSQPAQDIADLIKGADAAGHPEAKLYWDYKKGFKLAKLKQPNGGWEYWKSAFCLEEMTCDCACTAENCSCEILKPWPEKRIIKDQIRALSEMDPAECEILKSMWSVIGSSLISWSVSTIPKTA